ncbi:hypothetical protein IMZ08_00490 [Bacillus luteolus]|uniref:Uncharacterized protein n=1 Tax=Litchfieldia luteola TaxID=682179 RepID=A0ABR9QDF5_9BACI|nr:hypothetical protein [Cytobacillus luteolus]MBE4906532.1 hypothetical protein [Cytobacillus luteolus]MBP1941216.1 hypothetical protein [Cytobacillus luteolus]
MIIMGTFKQSIELEQALAVLENKFVPREQILVVFMDENPSNSQLKGRTKSIRSNGFEVGLATATGFAVVGASVGFKLTPGPILCGLIATIIGYFIGYGIYYFLNKNKASIPSARTLTEVTVMIRCKENEASLIKDVLWKYQALTVGLVNDD